VWLHYRQHWLKRMNRLNFSWLIASDCGPVDVDRSVWVSDHGVGNTAAKEGGIVMNTTRSELPQLSSSAGICGAGEAVTGGLCIRVAIAIFAWAWS
jgi:hypothetical protein